MIWEILWTLWIGLALWFATPYIDKALKSLSNKARKVLKNVVFYGLLIVVVTAVPMAYNNGVADGKVRYCADQGLRLVSFHGVEQCMSDEAIEHQRSLVASTQINDQVMNDFYGGENGLQRNFTN